MAGSASNGESRSNEPLHLQRILRDLPSVDEVLRDPVVGARFEDTPRSLVLRAVRDVLERLREDLRAGRERSVQPEAIRNAVLLHLACIASPSVIPLINATGVIIHTNLGRSLLAADAMGHAAAVAARYSNLEFDLATGGRGHRDLLVRDLVTELTGAEDALVVNNNAAAVLLALTALAKGREVVVSRGELIEIGGAFRIPDVMAAGGAHLREVGTTNKTKLRDYERVLGEETALLLKVHPSNYRITGFTGEVSIAELAALGRRTGLPVLYDLGSGALMDLAPFGIPGEPDVRSVLAEGADLVTFSGDKLLGGPQGGLVVGRADLVGALRRHPLARAVRVDKLTLAALEGTLRLYRDPDKARTTIPTLRMLTASRETLNRRARRLARELKAAGGEGLSVRIEDGVSRAGGGSLPELDLPTRLVIVRTPRLSATRLAEGLRRGRPPVIARVHEDAVVLDPRTVLDDEIKTLARVLGAALS